jgi:hypothetical protein
MTYPIVRTITASIQQNNFISEWSQRPAITDDCGKFLGEREAYLVLTADLKPTRKAKAGSEAKLVRHRACTS